MTISAALAALAVSATADVACARSSISAPARLLRELLLKAGVQPPYLLVGHSLGGLYVQKFAQLFPAETAGLVLLDNRPATFMAQCKSMKLSECLGATVSPAWSEPLKRTFVGITPSEAAAPTPAQLGAIPVLVLTAGRPEDGVGPRFFEEITKAQAQFAGALRRGRHKVVANATHSSLSSDQARETAAEIRRFWDDLNKRR